MMKALMATAVLVLSASQSFARVDAGVYNCKSAESGSAFIQLSVSGNPVGGRLTLLKEKVVAIDNQRYVCKAAGSSNSVECAIEGSPLANFRMIDNDRPTGFEIQMSEAFAKATSTAGALQCEKRRRALTDGHSFID